MVGGLGNPLGAIAGGFVIAFSEVLITYPLKKVLGYLLPDRFRARYFGPAPVDGLQVRGEFHHFDHRVAVPSDRIV